MKISASLVFGMWEKNLFVEEAVCKPFMPDFEKWLNIDARVMHERVSDITLMWLITI